MTEVKGSWKGSLKGGIFILKTLRANPQYSLSVEKDASVTVTLSIPSKIQGVGLGLYLLKGAAGNPIVVSPTVVAETSFDYDVASVTLTAELKAKHHYVLVPCWDFDEGTVSGDFIIKVSRDAKIEALPKPNSREIKGKWDEKTSGGDKDSKKFDKNEPFFFSLKKKDTVQMSLQRDEGHNFRFGIYLFDADAVKKAMEACLIHLFSSKAILAQTDFVDLQQVSLVKDLDAGLYVVVPCTVDSGEHGKFTLTVWANHLENLFSPSSTPKDDSKSKIGRNLTVHETSSKRHRSNSTSTRPEKELHSRRASDGDVEKMESLMNALELKKQKSLAKKYKKELDELKEKYETEKAKWDHERQEAAKQKERADRLEREKARLSDEVATLRKSTGSRVEELMLAVERLNVEIEKYRKKESQVEDNIDWSLPVTTTPKTGKSVEIMGEWKGKSAGGCLNHLSWRHNPQILLQAPRNTDVTVTIYQPRHKDKAEMHEISLYIFKTYTNQSTSLDCFGCVFSVKRLVLPWSQNDIVAEGSFHQDKPSKVSVTTPLQGSEYPYVIVPATFLPNDEGKWVVHIESQHEITATLTNESHSWPMVAGEWRGPSAGGCPNHRSFVNNPMYSLTVENYGQLKFFLLQEEKPHEVFDTMSIYLIRADEEPKQKLTVFKKSAEVAHLDFTKPTEGTRHPYLNSTIWPRPPVLTVDGVAPGAYYVVPCTFAPAQEAAFSLFLLATVPTSPLKPLPDPYYLEVKGSWKGESAGGTVMNKASWPRNPQFALTVPQNMVLTISLSQTRPPNAPLFGIGIIVTNDNGRAKEATTTNVTFKADLKKQATVIEDVPFVGRSLPYTLIPSTFNPGEECDFLLRITSNDPAFQSSVKITPL